jgi:phage gpG-like protein
MSRDIEYIPFNRLFEGFRKYHRDMPRLVAASGVKFFKKSFQHQGWVYDGNIHRWKKRNSNAKRNKGRSLLIDTGRLRRSIRTIQITDQLIEVGTELDYAQIHNEGGSINKTVKVPGFTRKGHKVKAHKRKQNGKTIKVPSQQRAASKVKSHSRKLNIDIDKRQFIGESPDVIKSAERDLFRHIDKILNSL